MIKISSRRKRKIAGMKFMLLCYDSEANWQQADKAAQHAAMSEAVELCQEIAAKGQYLLSSPLHPVATATSVRVRGGKRLVTDGPFAETREQLGGFYLIDVPNLETAIEIASRCPGARMGTMEIRPLLELPGLPGGGNLDSSLQ
jgi:hypothetical protein